jgi:hypothetical protein
MKVFFTALEPLLFMPLFQNNYDRQQERESILLGYARINFFHYRCVELNPIVTDSFFRGVELVVARSL